MTDLAIAYELLPEALGHLTSAVQFGFISGTLCFAILTIADRFAPSKVFFVCGLAGALFNVGILLENNTFFSLLLFRFLTGFSLAGIYPVGMKIASDYYQKGLGKSLGFLVGALVLGTAFPHLLKDYTGSEGLLWKAVLLLTSAISVFGGLLILLLVPDGPYRSKLQKPEFTILFNVFRKPEFRSAAFGYFGHMWELYAFWAFVPVILKAYKLTHPASNFSISFLSFLIIGLGGIACVAGGYISEKLGAKRTAATALLLSGFCCLFSPFIYIVNSEIIFISFLIFWGLVVVTDSPLFSTLVAQNAPVQTKGTALTIVNCVGFSITIISIQLLNFLQDRINPVYLLVFLVIGPAAGLFGLYKRTGKS